MRSGPRHRTLRRRALPALLLALLLAPLHGTRSAGADEARPAWAGDLEALRLERDPAKRVERSWALLAKQPDAAALAAELRRPLPWKADAKTGMLSWDQPLAGPVEGASRLTVFAYVPTAYTPEKAWPVLLWLHGGVARDEDGGGLSGLGLREEAEAKGFLLLAPSATKDCVWWSPKGVAHVGASLRELALRYRVDAERVVLMGFSDGGSGCYHFLAHAPDAFAGYVAMMGNPLVTRIAGGPSFAANCASQPVFALNGGRDPLYPGEQMAPLVEALQQAGAKIQWQNLPDAQHDPKDALAKSDEILAFALKQARSALPATLDWECVLPAVDGRRAWVEVLRTDAAAPGAPGLGSTLLEVPAATQRPRLGISLDREHEGPGLAVESVQEGTPAAEAGFQAGDVILKAGDTDLPEGPEAALALRAYLDTLANQDGTFTVKRGEETKVLITRPRLLAQDAPPAELGYGRPSGRVKAAWTAKNRVELSTRGVAAVRLHLARPLVDLDQDLTVLLNGKTAFQGRVKADAAYMLDAALRRLPGDPLYEAALTLPVR